MQRPTANSNATRECSSTGRVLVVDRSTDAIEVLTAILKRRGVETVATGRVEDGLRLAQTVAPDLIILDEDALACEDQADCVDFVAAAEVQKVPLFVLGGRLSRPSNEAKVEVIAKPYHYSSLLRKIENHLGSTDAA